MTLTPLLRPFPLFLVWAFCSCFNPPAQAQRLTVTDPQVEPVYVETADVQVETTGRLAVTTFELVFRNPNNRVLEGSLEFPLLDGQTVTGFALDVNGTLRDAVPVEKEKARVVFEEIERRAVDPGLMEQTAGNVYRARIYPVPAKGVRRVRVRYQEDLRPVRDETLYRLNLDFPRPLKRFSLKLNVHSASDLPVRARTTLNLQLPPWRDAQYMAIERQDFEAKGLLELSLPRAERPRVMTGRFQGQDYFYAEVPSTPILFTRAAPRVIGLIWDSSGSARERDHTRELEFLNAWFSELKNAEVRLHRLRDVATRDESFTIRNGEWQNLRRALENTVYDGATSLDGFEDDPKVDTWIVFSDGLFNFGATPHRAQLPVAGVVHTVLASTRADASWLEATARKGRGEYVDLLRTPPSDAAFSLQTQSMRVLAVEHSPEEARQVYPEPGTPIRGDTFIVTGVLAKPSATLQLLVGHTRENAMSIQLPISAGDDRTELAARGWAVAKINALLPEYAANREDIRRTSLQFGIVTPDTSLLVLETLEDYVRYKITPPDELKKEWEALQQSQSAPARSTEQHREQVVAKFKERVAWWEREFPVGKPKARPRSDAGEAVDSAEQRTARERHERAAREDAARQARAAEEADQSRRTVMAAPPMTALAQFAPTPDSAAEAPTGAQISLKKWSPDAGYIERLRRAKSDRRYSVYLEERAEHLREPGFFLDVADFLFESGDQALGLRVLSNLAELELDDPALLRVLGHRLIQANQAALAVPVFETVLLLRPEEPQSRRDLATACAAVGNYQKAVNLLWEIASKPWDSRFPGIELIAITEMNAIIATCGQTLDLSGIDRRLLRNLPLDLRVVLTWDANDCDIDLWIDDPNGETARYNFPLTYQGGLMSSDFTGGYGPEEFVLRLATAGRYIARINYFGDRRQNAFGPVTAQVRLITGFGRPEQQEKRVTLRLKQKQETIEVGSIEIGAPKRGK